MISTNFEVDMAIHYLVIAFLLLVHYGTSALDLLTLDICHTWWLMWSTLHQILRLMPICFSVVSYDLSHRPLAMMGL